MNSLQKDFAALGSMVSNSLFITLLLALSVWSQNGSAIIGAKVTKFEIVANNVHKTAKVRAVYILLEEAEFNENSIVQVFQSVGRQFCNPYALRVTIFSDRETLEWFMRGIAADIVDFGNSEEQQKAAENYRKKVFPPETGYFRAVYRRNTQFEFFEISLSKDSSSMKLVVIRDSTGGIQSDASMTFPDSGCKIP